MTREKAIKLLEEWVEVISIPSRKEAVEMAIEALSADAVQGECRTCKRSSDYLWTKGEDGTRCPIEEHYVLPKDGYCHLYEPYKGGDNNE